MIPVVDPHNRPEPTTRKVSFNLPSDFREISQNEQLLKRLREYINPTKCAIEKAADLRGKIKKDEDLDFSSDSSSYSYPVKKWKEEAQRELQIAEKIISEGTANEAKEMTKKLRKVLENDSVFRTISGLHESTCNLKQDLQKLEDLIEQVSLLAEDLYPNNQCYQPWVDEPPTGTNSLGCLRALSIPDQELLEWAKKAVQEVPIWYSRFRRRSWKVNPASDRVEKLIDRLTSLLENMPPPLEKKRWETYPPFQCLLEDIQSTEFLIEVTKEHFKSEMPERLISLLEDAQESVKIAKKYLKPGSNREAMENERDLLNFFQAEIASF